MVGFSQEQLDEFERTRQGKNICECGTPKEMYYRPWCPICEKPEVTPLPTLNFIQAVRYVEAITGDKTVFDETFTHGYGDRMKDIVWPDAYGWMNDSVTYWTFPHESELDEKQQADVDIFLKTFNLEGDGVWLHLSY